MQRDPQQPCPFIDSLPSRSVHENVLSLVIPHLVKARPNTYSCTALTDIARCAGTRTAFTFAAYSDQAWWLLIERDFNVMHPGGVARARSQYKAAFLLDQLTVAHIEQVAHQQHALFGHNPSDMQKNMSHLLRQHNMLKLVIDAAISNSGEKERKAAFYWKGTQNIEEPKGALPEEGSIDWNATTLLLELGQTAQRAKKEIEQALAGPASRTAAYCLP